MARRRRLLGTNTKALLDTQTLTLTIMAHMTTLTTTTGHMDGQRATIPIRTTPTANRASIF
jgi:hypothetical protein